MPRSHASLKRLYVAPALAGGAQIELPPEQSNYLLNVMRMRDGAEVVLFNGRDGAWLARLAGSSKKAARLDAIEQVAAQTPVSTLTYAFAPLKVGRLDYIVQKATEMGAGVIQPVMTRYTQAPRLRQDKLHIWAVEAAEQCEVLTVPEVRPEMALAAFIEGYDPEAVLFYADEQQASGSPVDTIARHGGKTAGLVIGPEGGFSEDERSLLRARAFVVPISLGPRILRADTAGVAALALVQAIIGDWR